MGKGRRPIVLNLKNDVDLPAGFARGDEARTGLGIGVGERHPSPNAVRLMVLPPPEGVRATQQGT